MGLVAHSKTSKQRFSKPVWNSAWEVTFCTEVLHRSWFVTLPVAQERTRGGLSGQHSWGTCKHTETSLSSATKNNLSVTLCPNWGKTVKGFEMDKKPTLLGVLSRTFFELPNFTGSTTLSSRLDNLLTVVENRRGRQVASSPKTWKCWKWILSRGIQWAHCPVHADQFHTHVYIHWSTLDYTRGFYLNSSLGVPHMAQW